jgi:protein-S-isoprenylcysteine O-methyltransferase Ste14
MSFHLWLRGLVFTFLVPGVIGGLIPWWIGNEIGAHDRPQWWSAAGWLPVVSGIAIYLFCLLRFLTEGGTPAIFFTRHLGFLIGREPERVVNSGLYRLSRNPMYIGVAMAVWGQAMILASWRVALYGVGVCLFFEAVVVFLEEPHLRRERGAPYDDYCRQVPRWF